VSYNKQRLHKVGYFRELEKTNQDIDESLRPLLQLCRETLVRLQKTESALARSLERDPLIAERVNRLMTIPAVGPITALSWALEVGERNASFKIVNVISRGPIQDSRKRNLYSRTIAFDLKPTYYVNGHFSPLDEFCVNGRFSARKWSGSLRLCNSR
jgi:hypothetical protein